MSLEMKEFFDPRTSTLTYLVWDSDSLDGIVIDPVLDYDPIGSLVWTESLEKLIRSIESHSIHLHLILETHAHADHLSGAPYLKNQFPKAKIVIGEKIGEVQSTFQKILDLDLLRTDGSQFDLLIQDGQVLEAGRISIRAFHTPGHTPACMSYLIGDSLFVGDTLFMPDYGTGRCDFPKGDAEVLYHSVHEIIYNLPESTNIYVGHDYQPNGRELRFRTTVGESKQNNIQLNQNTKKSEFVEFRNARDKNLSAPRLFYQSMISNLDGGGIPKKLGSVRSRAFYSIPVQIQDPKGLLGV